MTTVVTNLLPHNCRNQLYASNCPKNMVPMLTSLVNGASSNKVRNNSKKCQP